MIALGPCALAPRGDPIILGKVPDSLPLNINDTIVGCGVRKNGKLR